jgi:hypothetical protein
MQPDLATAELTRSLEAGAPVFAVHYACESFYKTLDRPARVSAIAIVPISAGQESLFSMTDNPSSTEADARDSEIRLLGAFIEWLQGHPDARLVHWDMDKSVYGFGPIASRYAYLIEGHQRPATHPEDRLFNLDKLLAYRYGPDYVPNPRLATLLAQNGITTRYSLTGSEQAEHFDRGDHAALARCTAERAANIAQLTGLFVSGRLQTQHSGPSIRFAGQLLDSVAIVIAVAERLELVAAALRVRHANRPTVTLTDEYDYQDLLGALLRVFFEDVRREDYVPTYAGGSSRVDFVLRDVGVATELKRASPNVGANEIGEQLLVDIGRYHTRSDVRHLVCLVYDSDHYVDNPRGLERDLTKTTDGLPVTVRLLD